MFTICIDSKDFSVSGTEAAWEAWKAAKKFAEAMGITAALFDPLGELVSEVEQ